MYLAPRESHYQYITKETDCKKKNSNWHKETRGSSNLNSHMKQYTKKNLYVMDKV